MITDALKQKKNGKARVGKKCSCKGQQEGEVMDMQFKERIRGQLCYRMVRSYENVISWSSEKKVKRLIIENKKKLGKI